MFQKELFYTRSRHSRNAHLIKGKAFERRLDDESKRVPVTYLEDGDKKRSSLFEFALKANDLRIRADAMHARLDHYGIEGSGIYRRLIDEAVRYRSDLSHLSDMSQGVIDYNGLNPSNGHSLPRYIQQKVGEYFAQLRQFSTSLKSLLDSRGLLQVGVESDKE